MDDRILMAGYKTNVAIMNVGRIIMVMVHRHECGHKENQYKEGCKACGPSHDSPFTDADKLIYADKFVNMLFLQCCYRRFRIGHFEAFLRNDEPVIPGQGCERSLPGVFGGLCCMAACAKRISRLLISGVRRFPIRGRAMAFEAVLVLQRLMHADHLRVLAVADGAGRLSGAGGAEKDEQC